MISNDVSARIYVFFILRFRSLGDISKLADEWNLCLMLPRRPLLLQHTVCYCSRSIKAAFGQECSRTSCICQQKSLLMYLGCLWLIQLMQKWDFFQNYSKKINDPSPRLHKLPFIMFFNGALQMWLSAWASVSVQTFRSPWGRSCKINISFTFIWLPGDLWEKCVSTLFTPSPLKAQRLGNSLKRSDTWDEGNGDFTYMQAHSQLSLSTLIWIFQRAARAMEADLNCCWAAAKLGITKNQLTT